MSFSILGGQLCVEAVFKAGWGSVEYKVWHFKLDYRLKQFVRTDDENSGWHNAVFWNMSGFTSRLAGSTSYRD